MTAHETPAPDEEQERVRNRRASPRALLLCMGSESAAVAHDEAPWSNSTWRTLLREPIRVGVA